MWTDKMHLCGRKGMRNILVELCTNYNCVEEESYYIYWHTTHTFPSQDQPSKIGQSYLKWGSLFFFSDIEAQSSRSMETNSKELVVATAATNSLTTVRG